MMPANNMINTKYANEGGTLKLAKEAIQAKDLAILQKILKETKDFDLRDENGNTLLILATHAECYPIVKWLLNTGVDVNASGRYNRASVDIAAEAGNAKILGLLLERGGNPDLNPSGDYYNDVPPIHLAADANSPKCIGLLLEYGADIDARDAAWMRTALHRSLDTEPASRAAEYLILNGADINARDKMDTTPLQEAVRSRARKITALLRERGAV